MSPSRILVRAPNWAGDAVMATPALRALRKGRPDAEITLEGPASVGTLLRGNRSFDRFLEDGGSGLKEVLARRSRLRAGRFDCAVLLPDSPRAALGPFLARTPQRVGYARDWLRRWLLTDALAPPSQNGQRLPISMVERYLRITRHLGCPDDGQELELVVDPRAGERLDERLQNFGVTRSDGLLVVTPGASFGTSKLWPPEHFAEACDQISRRRQLLPVIAPAPGEVAIAREIVLRTTEPVVALIDPAIGLDELTALVARCRLVLSNDTGPRQIAVALGRPVVVVMGPTDPRHTAHDLERQRVLREPVSCSPCHHPICPIDHRCMTRLEPELAAAAAEELLP